MNQPFRLAAGGLVNRQQILKFSFNGKHLQGFAGDSLAAALLANGIHHVARSFKFHRPRGIYSAGEEEPNALLEIGQDGYRTPNCRATQVWLAEGLVARSQLGWPSLGFDLGRAFDYSHQLWPAGFYNKTFKWPNWDFWEDSVRRLAGLGRAPVLPDADHYEKNHAQCDLLICGGGPAGLIAALVAGRSGLSVILADQDERFGGSLNWESSFLDEHPPQKWIESVLSELSSLPNVRLLIRTAVTASYDHGVVTLLQRNLSSSVAPETWRECLWTVRSRAVLLATGAIEQSLVFPNNDRPGIMLAGAVRQYANRYAVAAGKRVLFASNNDSVYQAVTDLHNHGIDVAGVLDQRSEVSTAMQEQLQELGIPLHSGARICNTRGGKRLRRVSFVQGNRRHHLNCDVLAVSGGWAPRLHLLCHARGSLRFDSQKQAFVPDNLPAGFSVTGSAAGVASLAEVFARGESAGMSVSSALGAKPHHVHQPRISPVSLESPLVAPLDLLPDRRRQWLDLSHDATLQDAELAVREGYESVEHFKRFTTTGMSVDQGKTGNINAFLALSSITGKSIADTGTTTFRPPYVPVTLGALAAGHTGEGFAPRRVLPAENTHLQLNACFEDYGGWQRPDCYPRAGETNHQAIEREVKAVRSQLGIYDNSPIGKIEVRGPDAAEFLHRIYANKVHGLQLNHCRYGLMLNESGTIIDDGIFIRLSDTHFLLNTTSGGASRILNWLEEWSQCEWPDLQVLIDDVTSQWANFTVAGPRARELLKKLDSNFDLSTEALPHMRAAQGEISGMPARIHRISFSGELSFEVNFPAAYANDFMQYLLELGEPMGITAYGIEALMTLRLEKGFMHVGSDTDGETVPADVGWGRLAQNKAEDFIGKRSLLRPAMIEPDRRQLVGLIAATRSQKIVPGGHFLPASHRRVPAPTQGWITSAAFSPSLDRHVALGMLRGGSQKMGQVVQVYDDGDYYPVKIVPSCFVDPDNKRLHQ